MSIYNQDAPCKNCPNRVPEPNCHTTCETYINYSRERQKSTEKEKIHNHLNYLDNKRYCREQHKHLKG